MPLVSTHLEVHHVHTAITASDYQLAKGCQGGFSWHLGTVRLLRYSSESILCPMKWKIQGLAGVCLSLTSHGNKTHMIKWWHRISMLLAQYKNGWWWWWWYVIFIGTRATFNTKMELTHVQNRPGSLPKLNLPNSNTWPSDHIMWHCHNWHLQYLLSALAY